MIEEMDKNIGKVIQYLKDSGQYDNTFILFTSDNGTSEPAEMTDIRFLSRVDLERAKANYHLVNNSLANLGNPNSDFNYGPWGQIVAASPYSGYKGFFYEGGITVPLVIKGAKSTLSTGNASGTNIIKGYVTVKDITPTILELANASHPSTYNGHQVSPMTGKSLNGLLEGKVDKVYEADEPLAAELFNHTVVRMDDWMGIHNQYDKDGVWNLYNLANDIGQNINVADQHPDIVQKMKAEYDKYATEVGVIIPRGKAFAESVAGVTATSRIAANNTVTIDLAGMFAPGYPLELNPVSPLN